MTLLDLAKKFGVTIQEIAKTIDMQFNDNLPVSPTTHVPDKYVGSIITFYQNVKAVKNDEPKNVKHKKQISAETYGDGKGKTVKLGTLAKDINVGISTIVEHFNHIFNGNTNPNSRISENLTNAILSYFGKEYLITAQCIKQKNKKGKGTKHENTLKVKNAPSSKGDIMAIENDLSGKKLLKFLKDSTGKKILLGNIVNYDESRNVYFIEVMGFKSLLYINEVPYGTSLNPGDAVEVVPLRVDGNGKVEYLSVSMKLAKDIKEKLQPQISKKQRENEFLRLEIGSEIQAVVSRIESTYVIVEFGNLSGIILKRDLFWSNVHRISSYIGLGQPLKAKIISKDTDDRGNYNIRLTHKECISNIWEDVEFQIGEDVECSVIETNEDGVILSICTGLEGFFHRRDMTHFEYISFRNWKSSDGDRTVCIKSFDKKTRSLYFFTKPLKDEWWEEMSSEYVKGATQKGIIFDKDEFGIWVEFDNMLETFIPNRELFWENTRHNKNFKIGEKVRVIITDVDEHRKRITASIKLLEPDPWMFVDEGLKGNNIDVRVIGLKERKFLLIETLDNLNIQGIIRLSEISWQYSSLDLPMEMIPAVGDIVSARIIVLDKTNRRLDLSIRQLHPDPWNDLESGVLVRGKLGSITSSGVIEVNLENGLTATTDELNLISEGNNYIDFKVSDYSRQTKIIKVSHIQLQYDRQNESIISSFFGNSNL